LSGVRARCTVAAVALPVAEAIVRDRAPRGCDSAPEEGRMGLVSWILLGLVVGVLAKWIMPGKDPGGLVVTIAIGIVGALVGGFLAAQIGLGSVTGFDLRSVAIAVSGALVLLFLHRRLRG
jgi:uncharacterized membrane protein YeaQ/YmgE (transglycosylase-associated protein family)